ncbi:unnamed protein product [Notodromas monacha]|uniref:Gcp-like domain-containing protein n=1 Tax=Notodromas monacha TaxID=399045 RepID=A0A7R9BMS7_9CRUS|nr:unnamed protein product [Notodromas monacha]CAG0918389.1 unnamed protein product [Notodromas monacha]
MEREYDLPPDAFIPRIEDFCASFLHGVTKHLCARVQRAMEYLRDQEVWADGIRPTLVVSGGVACNEYIRSKLGIVCDAYEYDIKIPPPKLCTDNGIMIAWNGVERWRVGAGMTTDYDSVTFVGKVCSTMRSVCVEQLRRVSEDPFFLTFFFSSVSPNARQVVSGGVACNEYIRSKLGIVCDAYEYDIKIPPPKLCTDNGIMIAWNGVERWRVGAGMTTDYDSVTFVGKSPIGTSEADEVEKKQIKCSWVKL